MPQFQHLSPEAIYPPVRPGIPPDIDKILQNMAGLFTKEGARIPNTDLIFHMEYMVEIMDVVVLEIWKKDEMAYINIFCFEQQDQEVPLNLVQRLYTNLELGTPKQPQVPNWMHTIPITPAILDEKERLLSYELAIGCYWASYYQYSLGVRTNQRHD